MGSVSASNATTSFIQERYIIQGKAVSKKNSKRIIYRNGRPLILPSKAYEKWKMSIGTQLPSKEPIIECSELRVVFHRKDKRVFDVDNMITSVLDVLVDYKILEDDSWKVVPRIIAERVQDREDYIEIIIN